MCFAGSVPRVSDSDTDISKQRVYFGYCRDKLLWNAREGSRIRQKEKMYSLQRPQLSSWKL
jgi:hypothetical protein